MKKFLLTSALMTTCAIPPVVAQHHGQAPAHGHHAAHDGQSPYAGNTNRDIKALSAQEKEGLRAGKGMGMAMPAELNGYPGPLHVLELAERLELSGAQLRETKRLYAEMQEAAKAHGEKVIESERELDALFAQKKATSHTVSSAVSAVASARGKLRETHLRYHLAMMDVLTPEQVATYNTLRGY